MARPDSYYLGLWGRSSRAAYVLTLLAIWTVAGLTLVNYGRVSDDLRTLHRPNPHLVANDLALQAQLSLPAVNQYFLVTGDNADDLLRRMGSLAPQLNALVAAGAISSYESPRDRLPIASERAQNRALIEAAYGDTGWIYAAVDLDPTAVQQLQTALIASPRATARAIDEALRLVAPDLWFGTVNGVNVGAIALHNVADINALRALPVPGRTQFVDVPGSWSASLAGELRDSVGLLGASFIVIISGLVIWTRRLSGAVIALVPATSAAVTFAALTALDIPLTLFHLFGAYLILGLGLDYGIFMWGAGGQDNDCAAAILLSAATTIVSFGLLSASATPMVQSFGITIFLGTVMNVFLVPGLRYFRGPAGSSTDPRSS
jgi:predicted exporter